MNLGKIADLLCISILLGLALSILSLIAWISISKILNTKSAKKVLCKLGKHGFVYKKYGIVIQKYNCLTCGAARKHPILKLVDYK